MLRTVLALALLATLVRAQDDPYLWLEEVEGEKALAWVEKHNETIAAALSKEPVFQEIYADTLEILDAKDRIVSGTQRGKWIYNFWRDAGNPRGLYRRASVVSFLAGKPEWDVLLNVDRLADTEKRSWVFKGMSLREPDYTRGLCRLSDGGSDAVVIREFDVDAKEFVEDGFELPEAKGRMGWIDADSVYVATDFGKGSLTDSGYPRVVKTWKRGTPLAEAKTIFEGKSESVSVGASRDHYGDDYLDWVYHGLSFYKSTDYLRDGDKLVSLPIPQTCRIHTYFDGMLVIELKEDWKVDGVTYRQGTVITMPVADLTAGRKTVRTFFEPTPEVAVQSIARTKNYLFMRVLDNVRDRLYRYARDGGGWKRAEVAFDGNGTMSTSNFSPRRDDFFLTYRSFLQPNTLYRIDASTLARTKLQQAPARFDGSRFESQQHFATSKDGTKVPYFIVMPKNVKRDGKNPTLLYGYGGFRISLRPFYLSALGKNWLERGGVSVTANIRGGGEYGPRWHAAALKQNRHKAFEDFEAIAEDLIAKKITSPGHLGIRGGSNGGLLVGAAFTRRPDLFGAVVCQVPLLDMRRYNRLLAGASWMAEYGNPDVPEEWTFIKTYSPYHNVKKDAKYPRVLFTTSTKDDRVHPGHARKMVARMTEMGHPVLYYENTEGGHAGAADSKQRAYASALVYTYLLKELGGEN